MACNHELTDRENYDSELTHVSAGWVVIVQLQNVYPCLVHSGDGNN